MAEKEKSHRIGQWMESLLKTLFEGNTCVSCGADLYSTEHFCEHCLDELPFNAGYVCSKCGRAIKEDYPVCLECKADMPSYDEARSAFRYEGEMIRLIRKFKTGGKYLAEVFADSMLRFVHSDFSDADCLVYVPMTESAEKKRGYNQSRLLAEKISEKTKLPIKDALQKTRETAAQKELTRRERVQNLRGSFHLTARKIFQGKKVILIDDVMTTGATSSEIARVLRGAGAKKIWLLTIASVARKEENSSEK